MIKWLIKIIWGVPSHECKFKTVKTVSLYWDYKEGDMPIGTEYIKECEICGRMRNFRF